MFAFSIQHRIAQETIIFKEEQLREAQAWMTRAQEMDALQSTTNHTLQAELRERTEHYNQIWLACQRQVTKPQSSMSDPDTWLNTVYSFH